MDLMRTPPFLAKVSSTVLTVLIAVGTARAVRAAEPADKPASSQGTQATSAASSAVSESATPPIEATPASVATGHINKATIEEQPGPDPVSIAEVGVQRLPPSTYPGENRGLMYGSLWLTFHGLQWPYMPAVGKSPRFVLGVSGWGWVDTSYVTFGPWSKFSVQGLDQSKLTYWIQQARMLLRLTPTYALGDGYFVQGQAELVGTEDQTGTRKDIGGADTDDLYLRIGKWNVWDLQVGRFEGWEVFHLGMGLDQNTFERTGAVGQFEPAIGFYGLTDNQFRPLGAAGNIALHYYPLSILRFELLSTVGSLGSTPVLAARPVGILDLGWVKLKLGTEYQRLGDQKQGSLDYITKKGVGGAVQFVFQPHIEFGVNAAQGTVWSIDTNDREDLKGSYTRTSLGGFANVSNGDAKHPLMFGVGGMLTETEDQNNALGNGDVDKYWLFQGFVAVQYVVFQQLYVKLVGGYSRGHWQVAGNTPPVTYEDEMYSLRLRLSMYF